MNKYVVDGELEIAYKALKIAKIADENGTIAKGFRGQISSFGAAVVGGSVCAAIAFFSQQSGAAVEREKLLEAIQYILQKKEIMKKEEDLFSYAVHNKEKAKEEILNAAIALKLAMNLYRFDKGDSDKKDVDKNGNKE